MNRKSIFMLSSSIIIVILVIIGAFVIYRYPLGDNTEDAERCLEVSIRKDISIKYTTDVENRRVVVFTIDGNILGDAVFTRCPLGGRYKYDYCGYGTNLYRDDILKTNKGWYLVISGKNYGMRLSRIDFELGNKDYGANVGEKEYFTEAFKISREEAGERVNSNDFKFYDKDDKDITDEILKENQK